jgi:hypothetical protein
MRANAVPCGKPLRRLAAGGNMSLIVERPPGAGPAGLCSPGGLCAEWATPRQAGSVGE